MKFLLLDIDDTLAPLSYKERDAIYINKMGVILGIPEYLSDWIENLPSDDIKVIWCTSRPFFVQSLIEKEIGFKTYGRISFINQSAYDWYKLFGIIKFCNEHLNDDIILADNDAKLGTINEKELPSNLKIVHPSDTTRGCLSKNDLKMIDSL